MTNQRTVKFSELFRFTEKQEAFWQAIQKYKFVLYGGAKSGGKSYSLRWVLLKMLLKWAKEGHKNVRVGLFCEDYPALKDRQVTKIAKEFPEWLGTLSNGQVEGLAFVLRPEYGGGILALRNLDDPSKYASSEFAVIAVDELTKNQRDKFDDLRSIIRWPGIENTKFIGGTNPGSVGHNWVKQLWIDRKFTKEDPPEDQVFFVPSLPSDNPYNSKDYLRELQSLPEKKRKAYWEGNWDVFEGQFFSTWNKQVHVIEPFKIPDTWRRFGGYDHGRAKPACFLWFAVDEDQNVYVYRELYVNKENGSERWEADAIGREVTRVTREADESLEYAVADSAIYSKTGHAETIADILRKNGIGGSESIRLMLPSHKDRLAGWALVHQMLRYDDKTPPKLKIFSTCVNVIETIPSLVHDELHPEDLDSDGEDHAADALRYFLQTLKSKKSLFPITAEQRSEERFNEKMGKLQNDLIGLRRFEV